MWSMLTEMCWFCWEKYEPRPKLFLRLDISQCVYTFRGVHTLIFTYAPYIFIGLHEEPAPQTYTHQRKGHCLMTSAHPTSTPHNPFSNSYHDECITFLITQLPKNKRKFIPKVLKVHINRIQLYLYSASPRNQCKLKPYHEWVGSKCLLIHFWYICVLTRREVQMAGYWQSSFFFFFSFLRFYGLWQVKVQKNAKKETMLISSCLDRTSSMSLI